MSDALTILQEAATTLQQAQQFPYGQAATSQERKFAGDACVQFCDGDNDRARTLWKLIESQLGYMPQCVAFALIRASRAENLIPDIEAPVPS